MARVPYVDYDDADADLRELYDAQLAMSGRIPNFHKILGHVPWIYRWWLGLQKGTSEGLLAPKYKRLTHVQTSLANRCDYCAAHNLTFAREAGIAKEKIAALEEGDLESDVFTDAERALIHWVTAVATNHARRDSAGFDTLSQFFTVQEIVEITAITAVRTFSNRIQEALWTDLEDEDFPRSKAPVDSTAAEYTQTGLAGYVRDVLSPQLDRAATRRGDAGVGASPRAGR